MQKAGGLARMSEDGVRQGPRIINCLDSSQKDVQRQGMAAQDSQAAMRSAEGRAKSIGA